MNIFGIGHRVAAISAACLAAAVFSACSASAPAAKSVKKADVEKQVADQLQAKVGQKPKSVSCPGNLEATQGKTMRCSLVDNTGAKYGVTVTVTSIKDNTVNFDIKVDDKPTSGGAPTVNKADVEKQVSDLLAAQVGERPKSVVCPGQLAGRVGATMRCTLTANNGQKYGLTVTVTTVQGTTVNFNAKVDPKPTP